MISKSLAQLAIFTLMVTSFSIYSCKKRSSGQPIYMVFDQVDYISDFPETFTLKDNKVPEIDVIGLRNFVIYDSIMILNTTDNNGLWSLYSLPSYRYYGSYLKRGEGPLEFMQGPSASNKSKITSEEGQLFAYLYDFQKGKLKKFNIGESIASRELHLSLLDHTFPPFLFNFIMMDSTTFFIKEVGNRDTQQLRYVFKDGNKTSLPVLDQLNQAAISEGEDFNILSTITKQHDYHDKLVEMPVGLNYINIYKLDGTFAKTLCIGEKLFDIAQIQQENAGDRLYTFVNIRVFDDFFGVIYVNDSYKNYQTHRTKLPSIFLFDWEGMPLAELKLENHITEFDIDFLNYELYTFDVHTDEFFKYDIDEILSKLKNNK